MTQMHAIISFDISALPEARHNYIGTGVANNPIQQPNRMQGIPRAKVPVRDGHSQGVSTQV